MVKCVCGRGTDVKDEECVGDSDEEKSWRKGANVSVYMPRVTSAYVARLACDGGKQAEWMG